MNTDKVTGVVQKTAASILLDSKSFRNAIYQSVIRAMNTFAFLKIAARN